MNLAHEAQPPENLALRLGGIEGECRPRNRQPRGRAGGRRGLRGAAGKEEGGKYEDAHEKSVSGKPW